MVDINRINILAKKSREQGLSKEEVQEQKILRREYIDSVIGGVAAQLDNTYIVDENGNKIKVEKKNK